MTTRTKLHLDIVPGGRAPIRVGAIEVYIAPSTHPPFNPSAQVFEEDAALLTSAPAVVNDSNEHPVRLLTKTVFQSLYPVGTVITRTRTHWLAVIYDFEAEPICRQEYLQRAWSALFHNAKRHGIPDLATPLLGISLSRIPMTKLVDGFIDAMDSDPSPLQRIWLVTPAALCQPLREGLPQRVA